MKIKPINERLIVIPKIQDESQGGIFIPHAARDTEKPEVGFVVAVDDADSRKAKFSVGDKIVFNKFATTPIEHYGVRYLIMLESSVLGIFTEVSEDERKECFAQIDK